MSYEIRLREEAEIDLAEASTWYQHQQEGLAHEFLDEVLSLLKSVQDRPLSYPVIHRELRRAIINRFPFCIFFRVEPDTIIIFAIMHATRNPARWQERT